MSTVQSASPTDMHISVVIHDPKADVTPTAQSPTSSDPCCRRWTQIPLAVGSVITLILTIAAAVLSTETSLADARPYFITMASVSGSLTGIQGLAFWDLRRLAPLVGEVKVDAKVIQALAEELKIGGDFTADIQGMQKLQQAIADQSKSVLLTQQKTALEWQKKLEESEKAIAYANEVNAGLNQAFSMLGDGTKQTEERIKEFQALMEKIQQTQEKFKTQNATLSKIYPNLSTLLLKQEHIISEFQISIAKIQKLNEEERQKFEQIEKECKQLSESGDKFSAASGKIQAETAKLKLTEQKIKEENHKREAQIKTLSEQLLSMQKIKEEIQKLKPHDPVSS